ncbi:ROK family protein [Bacillus sp. CH30_1T]|uniref:ROK family protein n=1 Tax=Bacillus sp. CH30_1T TaxID=2604836 RepID=UPI0011EFFCE9|nr:ROK family protein [Bacillus sp. CH30_1T]KAA0565791.1 ROK family protein [Bacillus sp. CH30_1T]
MLYGAIEAGGTKFVCAMGNEKGEIISKTVFPTQDPETTLGNVYSYFSKYALTSIGVGCFGPIELNKNRNNFGQLLNTPKQLWKNFNIYQALSGHFSVPVYVDTDVNAAALGEFHSGAAQESDSCLYITVGTGIGAGFVQNGKVSKGLFNTEMGHIYVPRHSEDSFEGSCHYHRDCLEGLASGTAIHTRYGKKGDELEEMQVVWELEAYYLAQAIVNYILILAPEKIILGGGVMKQNILYPLIRGEVAKLLNQYVNIDDFEQYIVPPELNDNQGVMGSMFLAREGVLRTCK